MSKTSRAVCFQWVLSANDPRGENQIRISERMVGMKVGDKYMLQVGRSKLGYTVRLRGGRSPNHAGTAIDYVCGAVDHYRASRAIPLRVRAWRSRAKKDQFRLGRDGKAWYEHGAQKNSR